MGSEMYVDDLKKYESELCETEIVHIASDTISEFNWFMDNSRQLKKGKIKKSYLRKDLHLGAVSVVWYGESEMDFVMLDFSATEVTFVLFLNSGIQTGTCITREFTNVFRRIIESHGLQHIVYK